MWHNAVCHCHQSSLNLLDKSTGTRRCSCGHLSLNFFLGTKYKEVGCSSQHGHVRGAEGRSAGLLLTLSTPPCPPRKKRTVPASEELCNQTVASPTKRTHSLMSRTSQDKVAEAFERIGKTMEDASPTVTRFDEYSTVFGSHKRKSTVLSHCFQLERIDRLRRQHQHRRTTKKTSQCHMANVARRQRWRRVDITSKTSPVHGEATAVKLHCPQVRREIITVRAIAGEVLGVCQ